MTMLRFAAAAGLALLLAGCVTCYEKADARAGDFDRDRDACEAKRAETGGSRDLIIRRDEFMEACMIEKGWTAKHR